MPSSDTDLKSATHWLILIASRARIDIEGTDDQITHHIMDELDRLRDQQYSLQEDLENPEYKIKKINQDNRYLQHDNIALTREKYHLQDHIDRLSKNLRKAQQDNTSLHNWLR